jgi:pimeloyl-ACP methyl ester carboxylesterase
VVELKGFGDAPKPMDGDYGPLHQAILVHRFIQQQRLEGLTLIGHSLGGGIAALVALRLLSQEPARLARLVLLAGAALPQPLSPFIRMAGHPLWGPPLLRLLPSRFIARKALELAYFDPKQVRRSQIEAYAQPLSTPDGRYAVTQTARQLLGPETVAAAGELESISVPTLLLWGDHDRIVPLWVGEKLQETLPRGRLEILEKCGHMPQEELPRASLERVRSFLAES